MEHCDVSPDETIALVTDMSSPHEFIGAAFAAAEDLGSEIFEVQVPEYGRNSVGAEISEGQGGFYDCPMDLSEACKHADLASTLHLKGSSTSRNATRFVMRA